MDFLDGVSSQGALHIELMMSKIKEIKEKNGLRVLNHTDHC